MMIILVTTGDIFFEWLFCSVIKICRYCFCIFFLFIDMQNTYYVDLIILVLFIKNILSIQNIAGAITVTHTGVCNLQIYAYIIVDVIQCFFLRKSDLLNYLIQVMMQWWQDSFGVLPLFFLYELNSASFYNDVQIRQKRHKKHHVGIRFGLLCCILFCVNVFLLNFTIKTEQNSKRWQKFRTVYRLTLQCCKNNIWYLFLYIE